MNTHKTDFHKYFAVYSFFYYLYFMENNTPVLYQPNIITQARYTFTEYEMRVLLFVVRSIQEKLNRDDVQFNKNLFGEIDYRLHFYLSDLMEEGEKNHGRIKK